MCRKVIDLSFMTDLWRTFHTFYFSTLPLFQRFLNIFPEKWKFAIYIENLIPTLKSTYSSESKHLVNICNLLNTESKSFAIKRSLSLTDFHLIATLTGTFME